MESKLMTSPVCFTEVAENELADAVAWFVDEVGFDLEPVHRLDGIRH